MSILINQATLLAKTIISLCFNYVLPLKLSQALHMLSAINYLELNRICLSTLLRSRYYCSRWTWEYLPYPSTNWHQIRLPVHIQLP